MPWSFCPATFAIESPAPAAPRSCRTRAFGPTITVHERHDKMQNYSRHDQKTDHIASDVSGARVALASIADAPEIAVLRGRGRKPARESTSELPSTRARTRHCRRQSQQPSRLFQARRQMGGRGGPRPRRDTQLEPVRMVTVRGGNRSLHSSKVARRKYQSAAHTCNGQMCRRAPRTEKPLTGAAP